MAFNRIALSLFSIILISDLFGQTTELYVGSDANSLVIKANQDFTINKLTLTPTADFDLSGKQITSATTVSNTATQPYMSIVYRFNATTPSFTGQIKLDHTGLSLPSGVASASNLRLHYHDGTRWNFDASSASSSSIVTSTLTSKTLNELTIAGDQLTLPVTWLTFNADKLADHVTLTWTTATEQNTKDFEVQHSTNTMSWTPLGTVQAAGNSATPRSYTYDHNSPLKGNVYNYYRIMQRDLDGKFSYSKILSIVYNEVGPEWSVYPNPATDILNVYVAETQPVRIVNASGISVWKGVLSAGRNQIAVSQLTAGVYVVISPKGQHKLVKQ